MLDRILAALDDRREASLSQLKEFLSIPSVSTKPDHKPEMIRCATWLSDHLRHAAFEVKIVPTAGHPIVMAKNKHVPGRPTVLFYGHYDVQPPEPLELWKSPPFEPTVRSTETGAAAVFARGAVDDKGQVWAHVEALTVWQAHGGVPVNVTLVIEGEEEIGSANLAKFLHDHKAELKADIAVISDTNQFAQGLPAITYGLRGLCYAEVFITGTDHDVHSGLFGGAVPNAANVLCELIASLHDAEGHVTLPGFYDGVIALTSVEREAWRNLPFDEGEFARSVGIPHGSGEAGFSSLERKWARPTCDVNGITAGYQGAGAKTVIASKASVKISMRLVPDQDPKKIQAAFEKAVKDRLPGNVKHEIHWHGTSAGMLVPIEGKPTQLAAEAIALGFGTRPVFMREGGSIPVVGLIKSLLGLDTLMIGFGLPDDRIHSPNEKFNLDALHSGTRTAAALYAKLSELSPSESSQEPGPHASLADENG
jgi:acetylornithine deacetylase/succinyl-diaminopimelate desuccinylase-like protein